MNTLASKYCAMCEAVAEWTNNFVKGMINTFETIGRARAAAELTRQGFHKEAKALLTDN
tara:strand:- start:1916 stop:2092 length:177 start_codon:yes stop_codon:yes gene_type:complete